MKFEILVTSDELSVVHQLQTLGWLKIPDGVVIQSESGPVTPPPVTSQKFLPLGAKSPIRGNFSIDTPTLVKISAGPFEPYKKYADAIVSNSIKYSINPLFILADFLNQGVNPEYNNPWGISTDHYPYGPGGAELGQSNGTVRNGPRKFNDTEWRIAFDRQFRIVATGKVYRQASTIAEWALIDAPPGADNDVHGTNAKEGEEVGSLYNSLVKSLAGVSMDFLA